MSDFQAIADRVEIEALRGEFTDAVMMRDYDRAASLFTPDGVLRMPNIPAELAGQEQIRAWGARVPALVEFLVQNTHPGAIRLDGDTASGRAYLHELGRIRGSGSELNYAIYHDHYQRTDEGWKFTERVYEVRYHDTTPLAGSPPPAAGPPASRRPGSRWKIRSETSDEGPEAAHRRPRPRGGAAAGRPDGVAGPVRPREAGPGTDGGHPRRGRCGRIGSGPALIHEPEISR